MLLRASGRNELDSPELMLSNGKRYSVCDKTYNLFAKAPYKDFFELVAPREEIPLKKAEPFTLTRNALRHPRETKGMDYKLTTDTSQCCDAGECC